jgi:hypothetical protein
MRKYYVESRKTRISYIQEKEGWMFGLVTSCVGTVSWNTLLKERQKRGYKWREDKEEDLSSCWMFQRGEGRLSMRGILYQDYIYKVPVSLYDTLQRESHKHYSRPTSVTWLQLLRPPLCLQKRTDLSAHDSAQSPVLWHQPRFAFITCSWSWWLYGITPTVLENWRGVGRARGVMCWAL